MSVSDVLYIFLDIVVLTIFGTTFSSIVNIFLSTQGQIYVVSTIVSAGYGFICRAYMPISSMSKAIQKITSFLPGTYGTGLFRNHFISGGLKELNSVGIPEKVTDLIANQVDANLYFFW